jgi:nitrate/nitrite transporter NarK
LVSASAALAIVAASLFIVLWGATANAINQFLPLLIVERFGSVHLGVLIGVQGALMGLVGSFAPIVTGSLYDRYSSYAAAIGASVIATFIAVALIFCIRKQRNLDVNSAAQ